MTAIDMHNTQATNPTLVEAAALVAEGQLTAGLTSAEAQSKFGPDASPRVRQFALRILDQVSAARGEDELPTLDMAVFGPLVGAAMDELLATDGV